jgi:nitroreductase
VDAAASHRCAASPAWLALVPEILYEELEEMAKQEKPLSQAIKDRRATPAFDGSEIPEADLKQILQAGLEAPSGYNAQPWRFVVVRDPQQKAALQAAGFGQSKIGEASAVVVACGDPNSWKADLDELIAIGRKNGSIPNEPVEEAIRASFSGFRGGSPGDAGGIAPDWSLWLNRHVMIAFTTIMWTAETLGYDTAPMEGFLESGVRKALGIPHHVRVIAMLSIGKLKGPDKPYGGRAPMETRVFADKWGNGLK